MGSEMCIRDSRQALLDVGLIVSEQVRRAEQRALGADAPSTPKPESLLGRSVECDALSTALDALQNRATRGEVVTLVGEAGVGKSELLRWLSECVASADVPILHGSGDPFGQDFPLLGVREAMASLAPVRHRGRR